MKKEANVQVVSACSAKREDGWHSWLIIVLRITVMRLLCEDHLTLVAPQDPITFGRIQGLCGKHEIHPGVSLRVYE